MTDLLLGIDAGQTVTKAVLVHAETGREVAVGQARVPVSTPHPRWVERDQDQVWDGCVRAVRAALAGIDAGRIAAIGLCGHNDGCYPVDEHLRPVRPAVLAMDSRAHEQVRHYRDTGAAEAALPLTGQSPFAASPAAVQAWLLAEEPAAMARTRWLLFCKDWLRLGLTGEVATDPTEASASFTDVHSQRYSPAAFELYGLTELADKQPPILGSAEVAGRVTAAAAGLTGLRAGTPVATGAHDVDAAALGMGAVTPGAVSVVMGTFSINQVVTDTVRLDHRWQARAFLRSGQWLAMSTSPASSSNLEWFVRTLCPEAATGEDPFAFVTAEVATSIRADLPLYLPFLFGAPVDPGPAASAGFLGVRGWHTRGDLLRALWEGVALNHRTHLSALREAFPFTGAGRLSGGGARSPAWSQLLADTVDLPLEVTAGAEPGARGAALLAGIGAGRFAGLAEAAATAEVVRAHEPDPAGVRRMTERAEEYRAAITALGRWWGTG
ncbi:carbohydrate kinase [Crossiella sp. CA-258035]|uniref:FGGY-family carbohydrate kinase n=1 Tax=Crossiella sp. CA-258035 TaxID=2981138 RepID=UPI0024BD3970|nr:FGGY-family carbohydrate kinase [Crossiella sp. CA-258035]WHT19076.1 carbohydrate kinase [Crossiella sp. CA-258035]